MLISCNIYYGVKSYHMACVGISFILDIYSSANSTTIHSTKKIKKSKCEKIRKESDFAEG